MEATPRGHNIKILDAHHHFWDLSSKGHWPWLQAEYNTKFFLGDYRSMCRNFLVEEYNDATRGWHILGTIHCEAERSRDEQVEESLWLEELHRTNPMFPCAAVAHVFFTQPDLDEILAKHASVALIRGVRSKPITASGPGKSVRGEPGSMQDPTWLAGLHRLSNYNFSWDLRVPWYHLSEAAQVIANIPEIPVVINHCGLPLDRSEEGLAVWRSGMEQLAALPNTYVKVSELGLPRNRWDRRSNERVVRETLSIFGYDRSMFASNLPVGLLTAPTFTEIVETVLAGTGSATQDELDMLFYRTAARVYRVDVASTGS